MVKPLLCLWCAFFLFQISGMSQQRFTISGHIRDAKTGEDLIGATVTIKEVNGTGAATNAYGFYSLSLLSGKYQVTAHCMGYDTQSSLINLTQSTKIDFQLLPQTQLLNEVTISSHRQDENVSRVQMGMQRLDTKELNKIPVLFGEKDVLKGIQLLPGVKASSEGSSGFNVRGGAADQNLILLDEATVYNASHLAGFFSVFNSDAIKDVTIYKGNEPAEYGGRLSSVLDLKMNDGNDKKFGMSGGIGLISSHLNLEGPIVKDKGSFIISARRTYMDMLMKLSSDTTVNNTTLYFYDINAKANYKLDDNNRIYLSGYFGSDVLGIKNTARIAWGNATVSLRWNHLFSDRIFSNTSLIFSNYDYKINLDMGIKMNIISRIQDYGFKEDLQFYLNDNSSIKVGVNAVYHKIIPGAITDASENVSMKSLTNKHALDNSLYISHKYSFSEKFNVEYGLRGNMFSLLGPGNFYTYDANGNVKDTLSYRSNQTVKMYFNLEPRITFNYKTSDNSSVKLAYARNTQNLHLLSNSTSGSPTDLWIPSSNNVKPEIADQVSLGYYRNFNDNQYEFSSEIYYKNLRNQIDYKNGAQLDFNDNVESEILTGKGRAYGLELYLKKKYGKFNGWISYTLSRSERKFDAINNGRFFPAKQDRTHDISIVGIYDLNRKWNLSATWVFNTGNAVTFPTGKYQVDGQTMFYYTNRNANRMPDYHRLDLSATYLVKKTEKFESSWSFSLYNAYGRNNPYMIIFRDKKDDPTRTEAVQTTLFKFIPSVSYNFKF